MLLSDLPPEVINQILCGLETGDLYKAALVNHDLHVPTARVLYRDIGEATPRASIRCLHTLLFHPHLAILVRSLTIDWGSFDRAVCVTANAYRLLRAALACLTRLTRLTLELPLSQEPTWILHAAQFELRAFESTFSPSHTLADFLISQPHITELGIRMRGARFCLPKSALPRLNHLRAAHATPGLLADLIEGRPVTAVSLPLYPGAASSAALDAIARSAAQVKKLTALAFDARLPQDVMGEIAARVPHLSALHLIAFLGQYDTDALLDAAQTLRQLPNLEFVTCMVAASTATTEKDERRIAAAWRESCPRLRAVILPRGKMLLYQQDKECWSTLDDSEDGSENDISDIPPRHVAAATQT
ncbi:hypothetical protein BD626DRAFT_483496 [Schizophyllum amplum]|uniref:F-box domain-containing protein n=1 Tax=Schizophyllum amplum TaxID=97359 RepID=A0A550CPG6_9AGAR|nr:hypothetical protein BD626DRAFT_483496 [Auriculariopsis ampla]